MATYTSVEQKIIDAAKASLAEDKERARRARMLESGVSTDEVDRRLAQARASREAHLRVLADPASSDELARLSKAQSDAARRTAGTDTRPVPDRSTDCEARALAYLRDHGPARALEIAQAVYDGEGATKAYINPTLYRLAARGEVSLTEHGWCINHNALKAQILAFLDDKAYNTLELCALLVSNVAKTQAALEELSGEGTLLATPFSTPSGDHIYYSKLLD